MSKFLDKKANMNKHKKNNKRKSAYSKKSLAYGSQTHDFQTHSSQNRLSNNPIIQNIVGNEEYSIHTTEGVDKQNVGKSEENSKTSQESFKKHYSVMLQETLSILQPKAGKTYIDATFGCGGHSIALLKNHANVIALDRDPAACQRFSILHTQLQDQNIIMPNSHQSTANESTAHESLAHESQSTNMSDIQFDIKLTNQNNTMPFFNFHHIRFSQIKQIITQNYHTQHNMETKTNSSEHTSHNNASKQDYEHKLENKCELEEDTHTKNDNHAKNIISKNNKHLNNTSTGRKMDRKICKAMDKSTDSATYSTQIDGILWDFGLCTTQLSSNRGFSFYSNDFLDMGMGLNDLTACQVINTYTKEALTKLFYEYGDEPKAHYYAEQIVLRRKLQKFQNMQDLIALFNGLDVFSDYRARSRIHPATKILQAIRMEVNQELQEIKTSVEYALYNCSSGTKLVCISFHSGEDRIIKQLFKQADSEGLLAQYSKKPLEPTLHEITENPASRSAKLRWCEIK